MELLFCPFGLTAWTDPKLGNFSDNSRTCKILKCPLYMCLPWNCKYMIKSSSTVSDFDCLYVIELLVDSGAGLQDC